MFNFLEGIFDSTDSDYPRYQPEYNVKPMQYEDFTATPVTDFIDFESQQKQMNNRIINEINMLKTQRKEQAEKHNEEIAQLKREIAKLKMHIPSTVNEYC